MPQNPFLPKLLTNLQRLKFFSFWNFIVEQLEVSSSFSPISLYKKSIFEILLFLNYFMLMLVPGGVSLENPVLRASSFNNSCTV